MDGEGNVDLKEGSQQRPISMPIIVGDGDDARLAVPSVMHIGKGTIDKDRSSIAFFDVNGKGESDLSPYGVECTHAGFVISSQNHPDVSVRFKPVREIIRGGSPREINPGQWVWVDTRVNPRFTITESGRHVTEATRRNDLMLDLVGRESNMHIPIAEGKTMRISGAAVAQDGSPLDGTSVIYYGGYALIRNNNQKKEERTLVVELPDMNNNKSSERGAVGVGGNVVEGGGDMPPSKEQDGFPSTFFYRPLVIQIGGRRLVAIPLVNSETTGGEKLKPNSIIIFDGEGGGWSRRLNYTGKPITIGSSRGIDAVLPLEYQTGSQEVRILWNDEHGSFTIQSKTVSPNSLHSIPTVMYDDRVLSQRPVPKDGWSAVYIEDGQRINIRFANTNGVVYKSKDGSYVLDLQGTKHALEIGRPTKIGRGTGNDVIIRDEGRKSSRKHATLVVVDGLLMIKDNNTTNGTSVSVDTQVSRADRVDEEYKEQIAGKSLEIQFGSATLASPHHSNQDRLAHTSLKDKSGSVWGYRFVLIDGAGGTAVQEEVDRFVDEAASRAVGYNTLKPDTTFQKISTDMRNWVRRNNSRAGGAMIIMDVGPRGLYTASRGDCALALWSPKEFRYRRSARFLGFTRKHKGGHWQLQTFMHNEAQRLKREEPEGQIPTVELDITNLANRLYRGICSKGPIDKVFIPGEKMQDQYAIIASDGFRIGGELLVPDSRFTQATDSVMMRLHRGRISIQQASVELTRLARRVAGDEDDITLTIVNVGEFYSH